jgi:hypothetical protein
MGADGGMSPSSSLKTAGYKIVFCFVVTATFALTPNDRIALL